MGRNALVGPATEFIAGELRAQRSRMQWTLDDIAERSGVPRSTVDRAMRGNSAIAVEVLIPLCAAMGLDALDLVSRAQAARRNVP